MIYRLIFLFSFIIIALNCAGSSDQKLAVDNPRALLAMEDSLTNATQLKPSTVNALVLAHNTIGASDLNKKDYSSAIQHFKDAIRLNPSDTTALYNILMTEGHLLYKRGERNGLWDAIEKYHRASRLKPNIGEPFYYIGQSYLKNGNKDFDLILESYGKAISLELDPTLMPIVLAAIEKQKNREKTLKDFWK